jgi:hypothetical protein
VSGARPWTQKLDEAARRALAEGLAPSELWTELLAVFEERARARAPHELLRQCDGGAFDWLAKLTSNRRLVFTASALGSQLAAYLFRATASK